MNKINFKSWAFRFMVWVIIINIIIAYLTATYVGFFYTEDNTGQVIFRLGLVATLLLVLSILFIILSIIKKENRNYQFWVATVGIFVFGGFPLVMAVFG
ncbi:hypothetical protein GCM10011344_01180 [Dokdonia pacifica]|uniref:Uncharacterized protein n=1 Tax=Dokdonia pacifica TaxID=1627892 RepID=A0A239CXK6_9FLAO|nr:hypothetical protein [Dokdonia pacifica]GGG04562.1 hypothetical protein GCM10011344_01180 [Dokdonia pacifica]SNS24612.1 hypothetical protein SAMN06265376_10922 [Dokdonia pacifica]